MFKDTQFQYILLKCGYTARLLNIVKELEKRLKDEEDYDIKIIGIYDRIWGDGAYKFVKDENEEKILLNINIEINEDYTSGSMLIKVNNLEFYKCRSIISVIMEYGHCGFFDWNNFDEILKFNFTNNNILYLSFDTESG